MASVGERLRQQREHRELTQGQVAKYEGISKTYLSNLERGTNAPNVWDLLARLALRYGCSTDYLLGLTDDPTPPGQASEIQVLYDRLSPARQRDLINQADLYLAEESPEYHVQRLDRLLKERADITAAGDKFDEMLDEDLDQEED